MHYIVDDFGSHNKTQDMQHLLKLLSGRNAYDFNMIRTDTTQLTYPLDLEGEIIEPFNLSSLNWNETLRGYQVLGSDPLIIMAVMVLYDNTILNSDMLTNFLNILEYEGTAPPFKRVKDTFFCSDQSITDSIRAIIDYAKSNEGWSGFVLESDPDLETTRDQLLSINQFISQWFYEETMLSGHLESGTIITWFVFRCHLDIPFFEYNGGNHESFIMDNLSKGGDASCLLQIKSDNGYYDAERTQFVLEKMLKSKVTARKSDSKVWIGVQLPNLDQLRLVSELLSSVAFTQHRPLPSIMEMRLQDALVARYKLHMLTDTHTLIRPRNTTGAINLEDMVLLIVDNEPYVTYDLSALTDNRSYTFSDADVAEYKEWLLNHLSKCTNHEDVITLKPFKEMELSELVMVSQVSDDHVYCFNYENLTAFTNNPYTREPLEKGLYYKHLDRLYGHLDFFTIPGILN